MELPALPDDAVLQILRFLSARELLLARAVCRSWRALALRRELWYPRRVGDGTPADYGVLSAVLTLAPCARSLTFSSGFCSSQDRLQLACSTSCAARAIRLLWLDRDIGDLAAPAAILRNQRALGRLRELEMRLREANGSLHVLLNEAKLVEDLKSLEIFLGFHWGELPESDRRAVLLQPWTQRALTRLMYLSLSWEEPVVLSLLRSQAASLQTVILCATSGPSPAPALAEITNLRELRCPPLQHMTDLLRCRGLRRLFLDLEKGEDENCSCVTDTKAFLRHATQLTDITFRLGWRTSNASTDMYFSAMAASGSCGVSTLSILLTSSPSSIVFLPFRVAPLIEAAVQLPHLQRVDLGLVSVDELVELATAAPSIRVIRFPLKADTCAHTWMHQPAVDGLLRDSPALYVIMLPEKPCWEHTCPDSNPDCHQGLKFITIGRIELCEGWSNWGASEYQLRGIGLFAHPAQDTCQWHTDFQPADWFHISHTEELNY